MPIEIVQFSPTVISHTIVAETKFSMPPIPHTLNDCCYREPTLHWYGFCAMAMEDEVRFYCVLPGLASRGTLDPDA